MRIAYYSVAPFCSSGFGVCTRYLTYYLAEKHEVHIFSYYGYEGAELDFRIVDRLVKIIGGGGTIYHPSFFERYKEYDVQILHLDGWVIANQIAKLKDANIIHWAILDHEPLQRSYLPFVRSEGVKLLVPMTNFGKKVLEKCPHVPDEKVVDPIPHGADPNIYYPEKGVKVPYIPEDAEFVAISVVDNNGIRENVPEIIEAFAIFLKETKADAFLYMHTDPMKYGGFNLFDVINAIEEHYSVDLNGHIAFKQSATYYPSELMRAIYSIADCLIMTIKGGSFELPIIESGLCKTPTIATNWGATGELLGEEVGTIKTNVVEKERGLGINPVASIWMNRTSSRMAIVNVEDVAEALRIYYENPELRQKHARKMREWVLKNATWDIVGRKWLKLLDEFEISLKQSEKIEIVSNL